MRGAYKKQVKHRNVGFLRLEKLLVKESCSSSVNFDFWGK